MDNNSLLVFCQEILKGSHSAIAYYKAYYVNTNDIVELSELPPHMTQKAYLLMQTPEYKATISKLKNDINKENSIKQETKQLYNTEMATEDLRYVIEYCKDNLERVKIGYDLEREYINEQMAQLLSKRKLNIEEQKKLEVLQNKSIKNMKYPRGVDKDCDVIVSATNALAKIHNLAKQDEKNNAVNIVFVNDDNLDE